MAKYNAALKKSTAITFDEDLSFLDSFIAKAKLNGAKEYKKIRVKENVENEIRFTPYEQKTPNTAFPFTTNPN